MKNLVELFCEVDDFCNEYVPHWEKRLIASGERKRIRGRSLSLSEIMTIVILFHQYRYRDFKTFYCGYVSAFLKGAFPRLVSYERIVYLQRQSLIPLCAYLKSRYGKASGVAFIDSAKIAVCQNMRIDRHKVFANWAKRGKTSTGWFYGFKIHLIINESGELLSVQCTPGNASDRKSVSYLTRNLTGLLIGDRGYLSQPLFESLYARGLKLITTVRKNMKAKLLSLPESYLLRKRTLIETVIDQLKNISQIEHSRHRSISNFMVNFVSALIAYTLQPKKPSIILPL